MSAPEVLERITAAGAAKIAGANAWGGGVNSISSWWQQNQMLNQLKQLQTGNQLSNTWGAGNVYGVGGGGNVPSSINWNEG